MALPTQGRIDRQLPISPTLLKIYNKNKDLEFRYYFTVYLERQTTPMAAKKTIMEEN